MAPDSHILPVLGIRVDRIATQIVNIIHSQLRTIRHIQRNNKQTKESRRIDCLDHRQFQKLRNPEVHPRTTPNFIYHDIITHLTTWNFDKSFTEIRSVTTQQTLEMLSVRPSRCARKYKFELSAS